MKRRTETTWLLPSYPETKKEAVHRTPDEVRETSDEDLHV